MTGKDDPVDPMTPADEGWAAFHEMYLGMRRAGFTMPEATMLIAAMFVQQGGTVTPDGDT